MDQQGRVLLIADDEDDIRLCLGQMLELHGYRVILASNGKEAFEVLRSERPCLVLLDLIMPVWTGFDFIDAIRRDEWLSDIPIAIVSAFPDKAQQLKIAALIKKPVDFDELLHVVKEHCGSPECGLC